VKKVIIEIRKGCHNVIYKDKEIVLIIRDYDTLEKNNLFNEYNYSRDNFINVDRS
jgi:hypothetical protein